MKKITEQFLKKKNACREGVDWFLGQSEKQAIPILEKLIAEDKLDWGNWLIVRVMGYKQYVSYAVFSAEQVIDIFEMKYPHDKRPRQAIEAAKRCAKNPPSENKRAALNAAYAARAAYAAHAADAAAAVHAATAAAYSAAAVHAAAAAADAAYAADAATAVHAAIPGETRQMKTKILRYGIGLLEAHGGDSHGDN